MNHKLLYACYASSDYYARETGISMLGFLDNNPNYEADVIFILDYGILPPNKEKLNGIASRYQKHIEYLPAKTILEGIQKELNLENFRGSLATYSRAFIDKIIPDYVERLLYIDSDTVVVGSVDELKSFDMGDAVMAGSVAELFTESMRKGNFKLYTNNQIYITCGIVLFDLYNWRNSGCYQMIERILRVKKRFPCADQTLINNAIPQELLKRLPRKYNYTTHTYNVHQEPKWLAIGNINSAQEIRDAIERPVIIHYPGSPVNRPWYDESESRRNDDYYKYKKLSPWKDDPFYSIKDYKSSLRGFHQKFGYWIHQQEIHRRSFAFVRGFIKSRDAISNCIRFIFHRQPLPSEGMEKIDNRL